MLKNIFNAVKNVIKTITMLVDFLIQMIKDILYVIQITAEALGQIPEYIGWLPTVAISALVTLFGIVIVYKVLGREG